MAGVPTCSVGQVVQMCPALLGKPAALVCQLRRLSRCHELRALEQLQGRGGRELGRRCTGVLTPSPGRGGAWGGLLPARASNLATCANGCVWHSPGAKGPRASQPPGAGAATPSNTAQRGNVGPAGRSLGKTRTARCGSSVMISRFLPAAPSHLGLSSCPWLAPGCPLTPPPTPPK